jgi:hypothetical protein
MARCAGGPYRGQRCPHSGRGRRSRFAGDLVAQELGLLLPIKRGVRVLMANGDDLTDTTDPSLVMMRHSLAASHKYEKARLVTKLRGARARRSACAASRPRDTAGP